MRENRSVPRSCVIPVLAYPDVAAASDWLCAAFGFRERLRIGERVAEMARHRPTGAVIAALLNPALHRCGPAGFFRLAVALISTRSPGRASSLTPMAVHAGYGVVVKNRSLTLAKAGRSAIDVK